MVYSDNNDFAISEDYDNWEAYKDKGIYPKEATLLKQRNNANRNINKWIGSGNVDVTDSRYTEYLKGLEVEVIKRIQDKNVNRHTSDRNIYMPHDYLYVDERTYLKETVGVNTGWRVFGGVSTH